GPGGVLTSGMARVPHRRLTAEWTERAAPRGAGFELGLLLEHLLGLALELEALTGGQVLLLLADRLGLAEQLVLLDERAPVDALFGLGLQDVLDVRDLDGFVARQTLAGQHEVGDP